jgi:hypothetical protein
MKIISRREDMTEQRAVRGQILAFGAFMLAVLVFFGVLFTITLGQMRLGYRRAQLSADAGTLAGSSQWDLAASINGNAVLLPASANQLTRQYYQQNLNVSPGYFASSPGAIAQSAEIWVLNLYDYPTQSCQETYYPPNNGFPSTVNGSGSASACTSRSPNLGDFQQCFAGQPAPTHSTVYLFSQVQLKLFTASFMPPIWTARICSASTETMLS